MHQNSDQEAEISKGSHGDCRHADRACQAHKERQTFFQLAGHKECFQLGQKPNTILKMSTGNEEKCFQELKNDKLSPFVPRILSTLERNGRTYIEMQDLLAEFENASVMDIKMGCRTYNEDELSDAYKESRLRHDMYAKMMQVDELEPTQEERQLEAITKPRYMIWRETISSTASLGFRIEGMRLTDGTIDKEFKTLKSEQQICSAFLRFAPNAATRLSYVNKLHDLRKALKESEFFSSHELIGSSLLFVHDKSQANIWLIDFAKTYSLPQNTKVTHCKTWELGNHEDGYLTGVENLIRVLESLSLLDADKTKPPAVILKKLDNSQDEQREANKPQPKTFNIDQKELKKSKNCLKHNLTQAKVR